MYQRITILSLIVLISLLVPRMAYPGDDCSPLDTKLWQLCDKALNSCKDLNKAQDTYIKRLKAQQGACQEELIGRDGWFQSPLFWGIVAGLAGVFVGERLR